MNSKDDRKTSAKTPAPMPRRFRIDKLEERIAPKKGGNTRNCTTNCGSAYSEACSSY